MSGADHCRALRKAVRFYRDAWRGWVAQMGRRVSGTIRGGPCPRYLVGVLRAKAVAARQEYRLWQSSIVRRLERGLRGSPMQGTGALLLRHGTRWHVSPYFMAAVAATESSLGAAACSNNRRNVWGLASCVNSWPVPYFDTWDEAIGYYAHFLASRWPGHSTPYSFRGYAACSECWAAKTSEWMRSLFGVEPRTVWP